MHLPLGSGPPIPAKFVVWENPHMVFDRRFPVGSPNFSPPCLSVVLLNLTPTILCSLILKIMCFFVLLSMWMTYILLEIP